MTAASPWAIVFVAMLPQNILLSGFLGVCSFLACSGRFDTALGLGLAVVFVTTATTALNHLLYHGVLAPGALQWALGPSAAAWDLSHLSLIVFIAVIAAFVQFVEMLVERFSPRLYHGLGIYLPLITVNCAILGSSLFMVLRDYDFLRSLAFGFGAGTGWALAILLMAGLRRKMGYANVPEAFRGVPMHMIVTGILALAFLGFAGTVVLP